MTNTSQQCDKVTSRVLILGPLPPPIGGVSSHIAGLANLLSSHSINCTVLDCYPTKGGKIEVEGINHVIYRGYARYLKAFFFLCKGAKNKDEIIHFHFSTIIGKFLPFSLFTPKLQRKFFLTVHHGDQNNLFAAHSWFFRLLAKISLSRMDTLVALSQAQLEFFISIGVQQSAIVRWKAPALLPAITDERLLPANIRALQPVENGGSLSILLTSGYPNEYYQFEDCLRLLNGASLLFPCCLIVCLYGTSQNKKYEIQLRKKLSENSNIYIVDSLPASGFYALLSKASIYLRPSIVDSYGLTITEALNQSVPCVASDICERDYRCTTYPTGDYSAFEKKSLDILQSGRQLKSHSKIAPLETTGLEEILECYKSVRSQ